jgi:aspartate carbamoyltransferase catalytic subunit
MIERMKKLSEFSSRGIIEIRDLANGKSEYFVVISWSSFNPSNHIHFNELKGKHITRFIEQASTPDEAVFIMAVDEMPVQTVKFDGSKSWTIVQ